MGTPPLRHLAASKARPKVVGEKIGTMLGQVTGLKKLPRQLAERAWDHGLVFQTWRRLKVFIFIFCVALLLLLCMQSFKLANIHIPYTICINNKFNLG